jgi:cephalosporin-C deacetylase
MDKVWKIPPALTCLALACAAPLCLAQELEITPFKPGGIYERGEKVGWTVQLPARPGDSPGTRKSSSRDSAKTWKFQLRQNNLAVIQSGFVDLKEPATLETRLDEPAMLFLELTPSDRKGTHQVAGAAVAPRDIRPSAPPPPDFDRFWEQKIGALRAVPPRPVLTRGTSDKPGVEYFTITLDHLDGRRIHGQLARPARAGKFPAMAVFQWAGGPYPLEKSWVTDRAAQGWLVLNIQPHEVLPDQPQAYYDELPRELRAYHEIGRDDRERSYFLQMYLADIRAVDYLTSRADWNGKTMVVTGTSMGGQQSLCTAAFHPAVTALVVHVPAGADTLGPLHGRASGYPSWPTDDPKVVRTSPYFDVVNCASRIKVPSLVSMGFVDTVTPPVGIWAAFNEIRGPKEAVPLVNAAHNHEATAGQQAAYTERSTAWFRALAAGQDPLAPANSPQPRLDENSRKAHELLLQKKTQGQIDVYFLGDSITRRWGAGEAKYRDLLAHWNASFKGWNAANFGWGGDTTQNILWRLENGELDGVNPKAIVLMAGTNNVGSRVPAGDNAERAEEIARGIEAIVRMCHRKAPEATVFLMSVPPRNDNMAYMPIIDGINARLARLANGRSVRFLNINPQLADSSGKLLDGMADPDKLHLTVRAYEVWANALKPELTKLLGPPAETDRAPPPTADPSAR